MPDKLAPQEPRGDPAPGAHRFKRRELRSADGGILVLTADGTINQVGADGKTTRSWAPDDEEWPYQALRFGVHPQADTVTPDGRQRSDMRPPRP
jgi:hypothetical protein